MITRENYEEYFLLYVDNELSTAVRQAVEDFVLTNPDLREEWEMMLQCRVEGDAEVVFADKELLRGDITEKMLSYIDGELDAMDRVALEGHMSRVPRLGREMEIMRQLVLEPDPAVVFPDKSLLYRSERKRAILLPLLRMAAAAVVVGIAVFLIFRSGRLHDGGLVKGQGRSAVSPGLPGSGRSGGPEGSGVSGAQKILSPLVTPSGGGTLDRQREDVAKTETGIGIGARREDGSVQRTEGMEATVRARVRESSRGGQPDHGVAAVATDKTASQLVPGALTPAHATVAEVAPVGSRTVSVEAGGRKPLAVEADGSKTLVADGAGKDPLTASKRSFATQALLAETGDDTATEDPENGLQEDASTPKKSKLRGLFRKVSRVLDKKASRDDDEKHPVYFGGFALK